MEIETESEFVVANVLSSKHVIVFTKKEEFWCLIDAAKPDVIIGSETWLKTDISYSEMFPSFYHVYIKDRADMYGGVFWGISTSLSSNQTEIEAEANLCLLMC